MPDGNSENLALAARVGERSIRNFHAHMNRLADVLESDVTHEGSRKQSRLAQDLETIADAQHQSAPVGKLLYRFHHGRELCNSPGAQVISVCEAAGNDSNVAVLQIMRLMPEKRNRLLCYLLNRPVSVVVTIRARKDDHAEFHFLPRLADCDSSLT